MLIGTAATYISKTWDTAMSNWPNWSGVQKYQSFDVTLSRYLETATAVGALLEFIILQHQ